MTELERINLIVTPIAQMHGVEKVWLFGKRARGDAFNREPYARSRPERRSST